MTNNAVLGIDYGRKRVGTALLQANTTIAFPHDVLQNNKTLIDRLEYIVTSNEVGTIVIGESKNLNGSDNEITAEIKKFTENLSQALLTVRIEVEPEHFSSHQAAGLQHEFGGNTNKLDASAAAIILQAWCDRTSYGSSKK